MPVLSSQITFRMAIHAFENEVDRKMIREKQKNEYVAAQESSRPGSDGGPVRRRDSSHILCTASAIPCKQPKSTNVHLAPCHSPPRSIVMNRFKYVRTLPCRLPPRDMYR